MLDDRGWVDGETPIEDFGMFLILDEEISSESAKRIFMALLGRAEGETPEVVAEITKDDTLSRSAYLPTQLLEHEYRIFQHLTS
jgi:hypothetical protein